MSDIVSIVPVESTLVPILTDPAVNAEQLTPTVRRNNNRAAGAERTIYGKRRNSSRWSASWRGT